MEDSVVLQKVRVVPHDRTWRDICSAEIEVVRAAIQPARAFIDHVGSTAIIGLESKPIIDLVVLLSDWSEAAVVAAALAREGYCEESVHDTPPRRFLEKRLRTSSCEAIHLHLTPLDSEWASNMLVFRDELKADAGLAMRYAYLKRRLAVSHSGDLDAYTAGKSEFVDQVLRAAAGAFGNERMLTHQRAELDRAKWFQNLSLATQLGVAILAAISIYIDDNFVQLNLALLAFLLAGIWFVLARKQRAHRAVGDQARRIVLIACGLGAHFSAEQRQRIFDNFTVPIVGKPLVREDDYFASRAVPGYRRLAELIQESAYWTRDLQQTSANMLKWLLILVCLLMACVLWAGIPIMSSSASISLARVLLGLLVFLLTSDIIGTILAHREATNSINEVLHRIESAAARDYQSADVMLLMSDYNAIVENAPFVLPGIFKFRRATLTRRWRAYLENKRR